VKRFHEHRGQHYRIDYGRVQGGFVAVPADAPPMARHEVGESGHGDDRHRQVQETARQERLNAARAGGRGRLPFA
jgi:hypothetical protein